MKLKTIITSICISLCLGSCIQDEAPNAEADIISCVLPDPSILKSDPTITNNSVILMAYSNIKDGIKQIAPSFSLTEGATIYPPMVRYETSLNLKLTLSPLKTDYGKGV